MLTSSYCGNCGKAVAFNEAILFQGKTFCSEECKESSFKKS